MKSALKLARLFLFSPSKAAAACMEERALSDALKIYGLTLLAAAVFHHLTPYDFPDANAPVPLGPQGLFFWLKVMMWQPLLMAALLGFGGVLLKWMEDGWLPLKVASAFLWTAVPAILMVCYFPKETHYLSKGQFRILFVLWSLPAFWMGRKVKSWRPLAAFFLAMNAIELAAFVPEAIVTLMRWEAGYKAVAGGAGLWMIACGSLGLKALPPGRPLPRALLPLIFALVLQVEVVLAAYVLGWLPVETLKALMYG